jgi:SdrD B-like domain/RTX calcium-binding nonapeptide repeat (4 copies)
MSKLDSPSRLRNQFIEALDRRWLLSAAVHPQAVAAAQITGMVANDANHNFQDDQDDLGIGGVTVFIDANNNGKFDGPAELSTTTNANGEFTFKGLSPGAFHIREIVPAGFQQILPEVVTATPYVPQYGVFEDEGDFINTDVTVIDGTSGADQILIEPDPAGMRVTINGKVHIQSLPGVPDLWVRGKAGDDRITIDPAIVLTTRIEGGNGDDTIIGGGGMDSILGGRGNDSIYGGAADDTIDGGAGDDMIYGGAGKDSILGHTGNDLIDGDAGDDYIFDVAGNDSINGSNGNDFIDDRTGMDLITGGKGNDQFNVADSRIILNGGMGTDALTYYGKKLPRNIVGIENSIRYVAPKVPGGLWGFPSCFLATAVVTWQGKADNCPELTLLRKFRDTYMSGLPEGPDMIRDYYAHAPRIVRAIENNGLGGVEWPRVSAMIQSAIRHIQAGRNAQSLAVYAAEYLRLKTRYV